jgi:site-specific DNA recombinase
MSPARKRITQAMLDLLPVLVYVRLSVNPDGTKESVDRQIDLCRELAALLWPGREVIIFQDDGKSAWKRTVFRPGYFDFLEAIRAGRAGVLMCTEMSRITRDEIEYFTFVGICREAGITEVQTTSREGCCPLGALPSSIQACMNANYSRKISEDIHKANERLARLGRPSGGAVFGYERYVIRTAEGRDHKAMRPDPVQGPWVPRIAERVLAGETLTSICEDLRKRGIPTAHGGTRWETAKIRRILAAPTIAGFRVYQGEIVGDGNWEPLISRETWYALQAHFHEPAKKLTDRNGKTITRLTRRGPNSHSYIYTGGLARCGRCGAAMIAQAIKGRDYAYMCCPPKRGGCSGVHITGKQFEDYVGDELCAYLDDPDVREALAAVDPRADERQALLLALEAIDGERQANSRDKQAGRISRQTWQADAASLDAKQEKLQAEMHKLGKPQPVLDVDKLLESWQAGTVPVKRRIAQRVLAQVIVYPATRFNCFDPARVEIEPRWQVA